MKNEPPQLPGFGLGSENELPLCEKETPWCANETEQVVSNRGSLVPPR
jgi:hypothetical protein